MLSDVRAEDRTLVEETAARAHPLPEGDLAAYDPLLDLVGDARIVMIGEATHGTHEFYRERARITTRLIREMGFSFVAIEGDWPEAYAVHRHICGGEGTTREVMARFNVFPTWMWGNLDTMHFVEWLRRYNAEMPEGRRKVGFYGLDLYSLYASMQHVIEYLEGIDPDAAVLARRRYACFEPFSTKDTYAWSVSLGVAESCEDEAVTMLRELQARRNDYADVASEDAQFYAEMSALSARDGEEYYRSMYRSDVSSWNLRDTHMVRTLEALLDHFGPDAKGIVWEHNTHIGDFRATADASGMVNVGQLVRERFPGQSVAIGFGTYEGTVTGADAWGDPPRLMRVPSAQPGSYDNLFHEGMPPRFFLPLRRFTEEGTAAPLDTWRGQRAIGVVYDPRFERGNYVPTRLAARYDGYIHIDRTRAVKPLGTAPSWVEPMQQTYPSGY